VEKVPENRYDVVTCAARWTSLLGQAAGERVQPPHAAGVRVAVACHHVARRGRPGGAGPARAGLPPGRGRRHSGPCSRRPGLQRAAPGARELQAGERRPVRRVDARRGRMRSQRAPPDPPWRAPPPAQAPAGGGGPAGRARSLRGHGGLPGSPGGGPRPRPLTPTRGPPTRPALRPGGREQQQGRSPTRPAGQRPAGQRQGGPQEARGGPTRMLRSLRAPRMPCLALPAHLPFST
jgi:hypothetical protein